MPHLLIYMASRTVPCGRAAFKDIDAYAPETEVHEVTGAGHWILHERPEIGGGQDR